MHESLLNKKIVIAIPCYNEEPTIAKVVKDFQLALPQAQICVFDNQSTDQSASKAKAAGANLVAVNRQGKGFVMQSILDYVDADLIVVVDGDDTYEANDVLDLILPVARAEVDMVVGNRLQKADRESLVELHRFGNHVIVATINCIFGTKFNDVLSGYRVFNRRFTQMVPLITPGFETETELTLQALEEGLQIKEVPVCYKPRPHNSRSKLRPFADGWRIMMTIAMILRDHQPLRLYGLIGGLLLIVGLINWLMLRGPVDIFLLSGLIILGIGFILSAVNTRLREIKQIMGRNERKRYSN